MEFGTKIQMLRKSHSLSQEKLAEILKINRNYLSRIETGKSEPSISVLRNIAEYFNVDIISLMNIQMKDSNSKEKIEKIIDGCHYLLDDDLDFLLRVISIMREEYVKTDFK